MSPKSRQDKRVGFRKGPLGTCRTISMGVLAILMFDFGADPS